MLLGGKVGHVEFFFFQAEDGIRDIGVTGVQTCALPISIAGAHRFAVHGWHLDPVQKATVTPRANRTQTRQGRSLAIRDGNVVVTDNGRETSRSEERRVGKESRYSESRYTQQKQVLTTQA